MHIHIFKYNQFLQIHPVYIFMLHRDTNIDLKMGTCTDTATHRGTQTHLELFVNHMGPKSDHSFPPGSIPRAGGARQPSPTSITAVSSQDKLPPLPNPDENYVTPIGDAPDADYVNGDGGWGLGVAEKRGGGAGSWLD